MRVMRVITGTLLVVVALPMLVTGGALWGAMRHRAPDGTFSARISPLTTDGYAIAAPDLDSLLRREAPFARGGQTTLRITATGQQRLFLGIAPTDAVERYLHGRPYARLSRVRLAQGPLPVEVTRVAPPVVPDSGVAGPDAGVGGAVGPPLTMPAAQSFWLAVGERSAGHVDLTWSPSSMRGHEVTLVVMNATGATGIAADLTASVHAGWISPTTWALLILGTVLFVVGSTALVWRRNRDIVYVVEPAQLPEIAARLGVGAEATPAGPGRGSGSAPASAPAPWFARPGGGPPHASSVAPTGRRYIRPPVDPILTAPTDPGADRADVPLPDRGDFGAEVGAEVSTISEPGEGAPDSAGDPPPGGGDALPDAGDPLPGAGGSLPGAWPPVRADRATPPVMPVRPVADERHDDRRLLAASCADSLLLPPWLSADRDTPPPVGVGSDR